MTDIFTYGTLMFPEVWEKVVSGTYPSHPATLKGYAIRRIRDGHYPVIFPASPKEEVAGIVYCNIDANDLDRLDRFEGAYYRRTPETVQCSDSTVQSSWVYVLLPEYYHLIGPDIWQRETFRQSGLQLFLKQYFGFDRIRQDT